MSIEVGAYYFPNYHPGDARNDAWHGKGWTEWELVKAAKPRYEGHRQPIVPEWGYFDESDPKWAAREIDIAADHGITSFIYDYYWYDDGSYLEDGLNNGFLGAVNNTKMKFALMWANHTWLNIQPATFLNKPDPLTNGAVNRETFEKMTDHVVDKYMKQPNYLRLDGGLYFSIYEIGSLIRGMGGIQGAIDALQSFRNKVKKAGLGELHINGVVWGLAVLASELPLTDPLSVVRQLGFSSTTTYAWVHHFNPNQTFPKCEYSDAANTNYKAWDKYRAQFAIPYHPNVSMGWDPSPRTVQTDRYEDRGYPWTGIFQNNTPGAFEAALRKAKAFADAEKHGQSMVMINAWNEWTEGSYLLPDSVTGNGYLEAIRNVFPPKK